MARPIRTKKAKREAEAFAEEFRRDLEECEAGIWWLEQKPLPIKRITIYDIVHAASEVVEAGYLSNRTMAGSYEARGEPRVYRSPQP